MAEQLGSACIAVPVDTDGRLDLDGMGRPRAGRGSSSSATRTIRRHACTRRRRSRTSWPGSGAIAGYRDPDRRGLPRLRHRPRLRDRAASPSSTRASSSPAPSPRPTAWRASRRLRRRPAADDRGLQPLGHHVQPELPGRGRRHRQPRRPRPHRGRDARATPRCARSRPASSRTSVARSCIRRPTSCSWRSAVRPGSSRRRVREAPGDGGPRFPPLEKTHARISVARMEEMKRAGRSSPRCSARSDRCRPAFERLAGPEVRPRMPARRQSCRLGRRSFVEDPGRRRGRSARVAPRGVGHAVCSRRRRAPAAAAAAPQQREPARSGSGGPGGACGPPSGRAAWPGAIRGTTSTASARPSPTPFGVKPGERGQRLRVHPGPAPAVQCSPRRRGRSWRAS